MNQYWDKQVFKLTNKYTPEILTRIIDESYVAVAASSNEVVSFYFINPFFDTGDVAERRKIISELIDQKILPSGNYAFCLLSATMQAYSGQGLSRKTLIFLRELAADEYDYLIGIMRYDNYATHQSSLKMGWKHLGDVGIGLLAVIGTTEEKTRLIEQAANL